MAKKHGRGVFTHVFRIAPLRLAGHALDFAKEVPSEIKNMNTNVEDREARDFMKIGLIAINVEASAESRFEPRWAARSRRHRGGL